MHLPLFSHSMSLSFLRLSLSCCFLLCPFVIRLEPWQNHHATGSAICCSSEDVSCSDNFLDRDFGFMCRPFLRVVVTAPKRSATKVHCDVCQVEVMVPKHCATRADNT